MISWNAFFESRAAQPAGEFLAELLVRVAGVLDGCPEDVQELFLNDLERLVKDSDA